MSYVKNYSSEVISNSTISGKDYAAEMKERANNIKELALNSKSESSSVSKTINSGISRISQAVEDENAKVSNLSDIMQGLYANMSEIQDYTTINDEVSNDLKKDKQNTFIRLSLCFYLSLRMW